jgi:isopenicillin N synthase-like dioxygenase
MRAVVMVGSTLEHATGGILKATTHRVRQSSVGRLSVAFRQRAHRLAKLDAAMLWEGEASSAPKITWYFMVARKARTERGVWGCVCL